MRHYVYRIEFETAGDWGFEYIEARTTDEAIEIFREYCPKGVYWITNVLRQIGKESGREVWADR